MSEACLGKIDTENSAGLGYQGPASAAACEGRDRPQYAEVLPRPALGPQLNTCKFVVTQVSGPAISSGISRRPGSAADIRLVLLPRTASVTVSCNFVFHKATLKSDQSGPQSSPIHEREDQMARRTSDAKDTDDHRHDDRAQSGL